MWSRRQVLSDALYQIQRKLCCILYKCNRKIARLKIVLVNWNIEFIIYLKHLIYVYDWFKHSIHYTCMNSSNIKLTRKISSITTYTYVCEHLTYLLNIRACVGISNTQYPCQKLLPSCTIVYDFSRVMHIYTIMCQFIRVDLYPTYMQEYPINRRW